MKIKGIMSLALVMAFGSSVFASDVSTGTKPKRYLVMYKSVQGYKAMENYLASEARLPYRVQKSLKFVNGMVVKAQSSEQLAQLKNHPEVALIEEEYFRASPKPVNGFKLKKVSSFRPQTDDLGSAQDSDSAQTVPPLFQEGASTPWGITAVKAPQAWELSGAGLGARVLVLDTGIDYNHPALKANFEKGQNFFEGENGLDPSDFLDKEGHGTHVAGTIAGAYNEQTGFTGVAPKAKILSGRVCGELGCSNIAVAEGINWGVAQKVDVINMSLGGPYSSAGERQAVVNAEKAGVVVVAASGNNGTNKVSFPAALPTAFAVGAIDASLVKTSFSQWGPELDIVAPGASVVSSVPQGTGRDSVVELTFADKSLKIRSAAFSGTRLFSTPRSAELVVAGLGKPQDFSNVNVAGKIALVSRGEITFADKVKNALAAKAIGVVIYNNTAGLMQGSLTEDGSEIDAAVVMIEKNQGLSLVEMINAGQKVSVSISTSTSDYAMFDGTSMASPHIAGVAALVKAANKKLSPLQVRTILAKTAQVLGPNTNNEYGAGLVQSDAAVQSAKATAGELTDSL